MTPSFLRTPLPLVSAPMAGGPSTVALARTTIEAGATGFIAAGNKTLEALAAEVREVRGGDAHLGVNVFVQSPEMPDAAAFRAYAERMAREAERLGIDFDPSPRRNDDHFADKVDFLAEDPVPLVSFTFGLPSTEVIRRLKKADSAVLVTVTTPDEAKAAAEAGADALVVQGPRAGGHSGTWDPRRGISDAPTVALLRRIREVTRLPLLAAGGVDGPEAVTELLHAGAASVQVGTMLLRSDEAGTSATHRAALRSPRFTETALTRVFTGRPARALRNDFIDRHVAHEVTGYPEVHLLTNPLRRHAAAVGDVERLHLWAGTGFRSAADGPAAEILAGLVQ